MSGYDLAKALGKYAAGVKPSTQPAMILGIVGLKGSNHLTGKSFVYKTTHAGTNPRFPLYFHPKVGSRESCCAQAKRYLRWGGGIYGSDSGFQVV